MDDDVMQYQAMVLDTVTDYYDGLACQRDRPQAAVAWSLDESTTGWTQYPIMCVATVIPLSIISIREGFLPDYLQAMLTRLRDVSDLLNRDEVVHYRDDLRTLEVLQKYVPYTVVKTGASYMTNVDLLLPPSVVRRQ